MIVKVKAMWISKISQRQTKTPAKALQGQLQLKLMLNIKQKGRQSSRPLYFADNSLRLFSHSQYGRSDVAGIDTKLIIAGLSKGQF